MSPPVASHRTAHLKVPEIDVGSGHLRYERTHVHQPRGPLGMASAQCVFAHAQGKELEAYGNTIRRRELGMLIL